ncbi:glycosyltransferase family 4 protein [Fervidicoccus fontis]|uniref:Glycosyltransferase, family 4 n=1 Tax=Fervidicoccus fontis (strain DSM 19380 / JCM 18336 / VKM B-2539 / Kam940) TaxID=1163730 RepID=I0A0W7_FERFK|nr:glycosyltransferase family 4 protein [Fervidicoccus fontis]AFH42624.1 glycosyltransferase, family 4 [Fervidicoccus fontis Kam940]
MKIALIRREYITHIDGVNRFIAWLGEAFRKLGHDVVVISWGFYNVDRDELSKWIKDIHALDEEIEVMTLMDKPTHGDPWSRITFDWLIKGAKLLKKEEVDIAIVNGVIPLSSRPKIAIAHGPISISKIQHMVIKALYATYDMVICVSSKSRQEYASIVNCEAIIPLPMKLSLYNPLDYRQRSNTIVHIGTRSVKNPEISIKTIDILRRKGYDVNLAVIGPYSKQVEELAKGDNSIELHFNAEEREKMRILCGAKALILPSSNETFSFTAMEAMACGTPVVVSDAVPEEVVIDGYNGVRVRSLNPKDYAAVLERLLVDKELWIRLSTNGIEFVKQFDYINIAKRYIEISERLIKEG